MNDVHKSGKVGIGIIYNQNNELDMSQSAIKLNEYIEFANNINLRDVKNRNEIIDSSNKLVSS